MAKETLTEEVLRMKKEKLVQTASALFLEKGIDAVRMTDIAEEAGIGVASLYRYFGTRTAMVIEAGTVLWKDVRQQFSGVFSKTSYQSETGILQIADQFDFMLVLYRKRPDFIRFLDAFDRLMLSEKVPPEMLTEYAASIVNLQDLFLASCRKGEKDGSVRSGLDYRTVYISVAHAMNAVAEKIARGPILAEDDFSHIETEPAKLRELLLYYLQAEPKASKKGTRGKKG